MMTWLNGRSRRERAMIAVAAAATALTLLWLAGSALRDWRLAAQADWAAAQRNLGVARTLEAQPSATAASLSSVQADALRAGLAAEVAEAEDGLTLTVAAAPTAALFDLLIALDRKGQTPDSLTVVENADATLQMQATLPKPG